MKISGTIESNLMAALTSARRLRGDRVHADTIAHWQGLVRHARRGLQGGIDAGGTVNRLVLELEGELVARPRG